MDSKLRQYAEELSELATPYDHRDWQFHRMNELNEAIVQRVLEMYKQDKDETPQEKELRLLLDQLIDVGHKIKTMENKVDGKHGQ